ncbi:MAG: glycosyltransferase, partial [Chthoniobacterales bacterium]|nr:glycosyltransferase [Chthoniobacterales bacterium]
MPQDTELVVCHYHWRTGGVRRVVEHSLPALLKHPAAENIRRVILLSGEPPPHAWLHSLRCACHPITIEPASSPNLGYISELKYLPNINNLSNFLQQIIHRNTRAVWTQNPSLARNPYFLRALIEACSQNAVPLIFHHHDFWCDNRWQRWQEIKKIGQISLQSLAQTLFTPYAIHACITSSDTNLLSKSLSKRVFWLPNPFLNKKALAEALEPHQLSLARKYLIQASGQNNPSSANNIWLLPSRVLRRKNVLEALLLLKHFTTNGFILIPDVAGSGDEQHYWQALQSLAKSSSLPLRLLPSSKPDSPPFWSFMATADVLALPSLIEGFGLAFLEAAALQKPLLCRKLHNVEPDLQNFGLSYPNSYEDIWIEFSGKFAERELQRQEQLWIEWTAKIPREFHPFLSIPPARKAIENGSIAFSRLTFTGQLELVRRSAPPFHTSLPSKLTPPHWSKEPTELCDSHFANKFWMHVSNFFDTISEPHTQDCAWIAQQDIARDKLCDKNLYPLLWTTEFSVADS